jgi:hypothetical protein
MNEYDEEGYNIEEECGTTHRISEEKNILRSIKEWTRHWKRVNEGDDSEIEEEQILSPPATIKYLARPETRGIGLVADLERVNRISRERELMACENDEEIYQVKAWKKWDVFANHVEAALETREHRVIFYMHLGTLMDEEMRRIVRNNANTTENALNQEAILDIIYTVDKWYSNYFSATTGTSVVLSGGSRGGVSSDISADDLMEEEESAKKELLNLWNLRTRLFFLAYPNKWLTDQTKGEDIVELHDLLKYGEEGGCLVDVKTPVLSFDLQTMILACEALYRCWAELPFSRGLLRYVELLKARYAALGAVMFSDMNTLNVPEWRTTYTQGDQTFYHVNQAYVVKCNATLGNVERAMIDFQSLLSDLGRVSPTPMPYNMPLTMNLPQGHVTSKELHRCFSDWVCEYTEASRGEFIQKTFRKYIIAELVRSGEYSEYRQKNPLGDPNATNIISKLRPNDMDRFRKHITGASLKELIRSTSDAVGMITARNELALASLEYFCVETSITRIEWSTWFTRKNGAKASSLKGKSCFPMVIQTCTGGYVVWCPWMQYLPRRQRRSLKRRKQAFTGVCRLYSILNFHEAFHLACALMIRHYRDIWNAMVCKHSSSSTRTPKNIASEVTMMYEQARRVLVHIYGGCALDDHLFKRIMKGLDYDGEPFRARIFDRDVYLESQKSLTHRNVSPYELQCAQRDFESKEENRRRKHYDKIRALYIHPVLEEVELFPELFSEETLDERHPIKGKQHSQTTYTCEMSRHDIARVELIPTTDKS